MGPKALIEKPRLDGKRMKGYFGSEKLGNKCGCQLEGGESSGSQRCHLIIIPLSVYQSSCQISSNFKHENLSLQVSLTSLPSLSIPFPSKQTNEQQQNTIFRLISFNHHRCSLSQNSFSVSYCYFQPVCTWFLGLSPVSHLFRLTQFAVFPLRFQLNRIKQNLTNSSQPGRHNFLKTL